MCFCMFLYCFYLGGFVYIVLLLLPVNNQVACLFLVTSTYLTGKTIFNHIFFHRVVFTWTLITERKDERVQEELATLSGNCSNVIGC